MGDHRRKTISVTLFLAMTLISLINGDNNSIQLNDDVLGLIVLKSDLHDPSSHLASWNEDDASPCSWSYVKCNPKTSRVTDLSLSGLGLTGTIGRGIQKLQHLKTLSLSNNNFTGNIMSLSNNNNLQRLDLSHNNLSGTIPSSLGSAKHLDLTGNSFSGSLSNDLFTNCSSLTYLSLSHNLLEGELPSTLFRCSVLNTLNLSSNRFSGNPSFVSGLWKLERLRTLDLSFNALSGTSLSHNNLTGPIPKPLSNLQELKILNLEANKLSGEVPKELGGLHNLLLVNISFNRLIGRLPNGGVFQRLDQSALQGNLGICSPLLRGPCRMNVSKPIVIDPNSYGNRNNNEGRHGNRTSNGSSKYHNGMFLSVSVVVAISAAILIFLGVIIVTLLNASVRRKLAFVDNALESILSGSSRSARSLVAGKLVMLNTRTSRSSSSSQEFARNPESHLNKASRIGEGVFGTVYKAPLGEQGSNLAVKKLVMSPIIENLEDFDREVRILAKAKHPNLVLIKGYYWTPETQLLVSEYIPNGNLHSKLHGREPSAPPLSWDARYRIILGTAKGLAYLHHTCRPTTIHFNLKPSNILLDEKYNPKISDFGLSRLVTQDGNTMNNRFQNALGYMAPELECQNLRVNEKCDVYGFGVLILELVTGRRPVEYGEDSFVILSDHVRVMLEQGNVLECIDPTMEDEYSEDEVLPVVKLALVCTSQIPSNRPTMAEIVQILQVITSPVPHRMLDSF
ncbi:hypothetical protein F2Q68_00018710 [Brassica cretica]|uniref:Protein kinase domain-containing protein n=1 Tax=Brassica cretica TaxID=69181 RepID=A0A8S9FYU3_BRACR|nr:hypothetical protein F2Q68_00018710 [Brassica cretica]